MRAAVATSAVLGLAGLAVALTSAHLAGAPVLLVTSTVVAVVAVAGLAAQPWLARVRGPAHAATGLVVVTLVLAHVVACWPSPPTTPSSRCRPTAPPGPAWR